MKLLMFDPLVVQTQVLLIQSFRIWIRNKSVSSLNFDLAYFGEVNFKHWFYFLFCFFGITVTLCNMQILD